MPQLDLEQEMETLTEMVHACRVDASQATASVEADGEKIKATILQELKSFEHVKETVEKALWIEMIKMFKTRKKTSFRHSSSVLLDQEQIPCVVSL
jgi:cytolysin (calcineurin-like family phosphatase)